MERGYADVNGLHLYYEIHGDRGTPLVLLHGGVMTIELTYASLLPTLIQRHRVIGVDFQAHGRTADIDRDLTYANLASDVVGLLDELGIDRAHVIGHSMGGGTALELAVNHGARLRSVVPISASVRPEGMHPDLADPSTYATSTRMPTEQDFADMAAAYAEVAPHPERFADL
ncbi:MAG TPA: alpha/beta hydrolase, partial [Acidimicrobiales bacterium]